jgi:2-aminoadipate transaminase
MEFQFSDRLKNLKANAIREIFKVLSVPGMISFAGGLPASDCLPYADIKTCADEILSSDQKTAVLQYGATEGYLPLRQAGIEFVKRFGIEGITLDNIIVLSGGQQTIDLMCKALLNKGDRVLVEAPTYLAALHIIKTYEGEAVGVRSDEDGIDLSDLEQKIKKYKPKFLYVVPNFSNPKGCTYGVEKRRALAELSAKYALPLLEDDPYRELRYAGSHLNGIKSFDKTGNVVYSVSFSKTIAPSLRVALCVGDDALIKKLILGKQASDVHTNGLCQAVVHKFITSGLFEKNIEKALPVYKAKFAKMRRELALHMPEELELSKTDGGLFIWGRFKNDAVDCAELFGEAVKNKVAYVCGNDFFADGSGKNTIRLNYTNASLEQIETGVQRLGTLFKSKIASR